MPQNLEASTQKYAVRFLETLVRIIRRRGLATK
jgi:hypothetical protein